MSSLVAGLTARCHAEPDRVLIHLPAHRAALTAAGVLDMQERWGQWLRTAGLRPGELVVSCVGNRPEALAVLLACWTMGVTVMPVDIGATRTELHQIAERFGARAVVATASLDHPDAIGSSADSLVISALQGQSTHYPGVALLKLTSGSTGLPKAVQVTEPQLVADGRQICSTMGIGEEDTQIAAIPLSHAYGFTVLLLPLLLRGTPMVLRESFVPQQLPDDARAVRARRFPGVPYMFDYFLAHPPADGWPPSLNRIISAGARLPATTARAFHERFGVKIHGFYGTTETGGITFDDSPEIDAGDSVGRPLDGVTLSFVPDPDLDGARRVHVRSAGVASGYVGTEQGDFLDNGFLTSDIGELDARGHLLLRGRVSSFINVAGRKVQPDEVETVLRAMPGLADVRVLGISDPRRGEQVAACLVVKPAHAVPSVVDVRQFCAQRLAPHKIPRLIVFAAAIPLTTRGKTDRAALDRLVREQIDGRT